MPRGQTIVCSGGRTRPAVTKRIAPRIRNPQSAAGRGAATSMREQVAHLVYRLAPFEPSRGVL